MPYSFITQSQFKSALAQRISDITNQLFPSAELALYQNEALQTFNAVANFYRKEFAFDTSIGVPWYDVTTQVNTLRAFSVTDQNIANLIEYHLLEPQTGEPATWTGSKQFTYSDLLNAIQQMRDQVLSESTCTVVESLIAATPGRTFLSDNAIDLRRVCWLPVTSSFTPNCVLPSDLWATQSYEAGFPQLGNGTPMMFRKTTEPPLSFDVDIQPAVNGQYDVLTVNAGATLNSASATTLNVPNDWSWVVKYGAMAQLFDKESLGRDPLRSQYCWSRYKQGIAMMHEAPAVLGGRINDVPVIIEALSNLDFYFANWQGKAQNQPQYLGYSGLNMLAAVPIPNAVYSITASVIANMPLPSSDGDFLQIGRDDVSAVLDLAQHVAMIKCGGAEFQATFPLYQNFIRHCSLYNSKLKAMSLTLEYIDGRSQEEETVNPVFSKTTPQTVESNG